MKLEKALSLEVNSKITSNKADILYDLGKIKSKFAFTCPDDNCEAQVTCANLNRPKHLRKRDPYFKVVSEHSGKCLIQKELLDSIVKKKWTSNDFYSEEDEYIDGAIRLNLQPPSIKKPNQLGEQDTQEGDEYSKVRRKDEHKGGKRKTQRSKTLGSMIDSFLNGENFVVQMPSIGTIELKDLFIEIDNQEILEQPDEIRVYYGAAWFNSNKYNEDYNVNFTNKLLCEGIHTSPSSYIPKSFIEQSSYSKYNQLNFDKLISEPPKKVFILSESVPFLKDEKYINIWLKGLEYIEYRNTYLTKLK